MKIDPAIAALVLDGAQALAKFLWDKVNGDDTDDAKRAIDAIKRRALQAGIDAAIREAQLLADAAGLTLALDDLGDAATRVLQALEAAGTIPKLPQLGDVEIVE